MHAQESPMRSFSCNSRYFLELLQQNINKLELPANTQILNLRISQQKFKRAYSSKRQGLKISLSKNHKHRGIKSTFWFKQVDNPKELYNSMTFVYSSLKQKGIHSPAPEPLLFDENAGGILMTLKKVLNLFPLTLAFCLPFTKSLVSKLPQYYFRIGKWLQKYHNAMATGRLVTTRSKSWKNSRIQ